MLKLCPGLHLGRSLTHAPLLLQALEPTPRIAVLEACNGLIDLMPTHALALELGASAVVQHYHQGSNQRTDGGCMCTHIRWVLAMAGMYGK
jgi:hypothetical protein